MQIWDEIKKSYYSGSISTKIIYANIGIFIVVKLISVIITMFAGGISGTDIIYDALAVSSDWNKLMLRPWTIISYQFLHIEFFHIAINMLWLYWFGQFFLNFFTKRQILSVYIWGGLWGAIFYLLAFNLIPYFANNFGPTPMIGASASILAIVIAAATSAPNQDIQLALIGRVKLKYLALTVLVIDLMSITSGNAGGHIAHLGGAFAGYWFATQYINNNKDITKWIAQVIDTLSTFFKFDKKKSNLNARKKTGKQADRSFNKRKMTQQKGVDKILEKIKSSGYNSLTKKEKEQLFNESSK